MSKFVNLLIYPLVCLGVVVLGAFILYRITIGAVNFPSGSYQVDPKQLGERIVVPEGFAINLYAEVENARVLRFSHSGHLLVANPNKDRITILSPDLDNDGRADSSRVLLSDLNGPNGLDFYQDWLYVAETDAIGRIKFDHATGQTIGHYQKLVTSLPPSGNHWKKTLRFGPEQMLYVTMGSSCNACLETDQRRATMVRYTPEGKDEHIFAKGLRNNAGFDWSPIDGEIYATDNGRDLLGDNFPPCELNQVIAGGHYGWPYANGNQLPDPDFGGGNAAIIAASIAPVFHFQAHNAPLGIEFVRRDKFPKLYRHAAIVALHGSWNRSEKDGYKVVSLHWDEQGNISSRDFVSGFLQDDTVIGRPTEVTEGPDGAFYISDDYAHAVYRVAYGEFGTPRLNHNRIAFNAAETLSHLSVEDKIVLITQGKKLWDQYQCISCHHGSNSALKQLKELGSRYDTLRLKALLRRPHPPMLIFPFGDEQRNALAVYLLERYP